MNLRNKWKETNGIGKISFSILVFSIVMVVFYGIFLGWKPSSDAGDWGNFGSYFASITGLLAFSGVLYTASLSEKRAKVAEQQIKTQEERGVFFKMLELYQKQADTKKKLFTTYNDEIKCLTVTYIIYKYIIDNYKLLSDKTSEVSRICSVLSIELHFSPNNPFEIQSELMGILENNQIKSFGPLELLTSSGANYYHYIRLAVNDIIVKDQISLYVYEEMRYMGNLVHTKYGDTLGQYYRNIYYLFDINNKATEKDKYFKIFRAQLSPSELSILLYNSVSKFSTKKSFKYLVENNIFNNLTENDIHLYSFISYKYSIKEFVNILLEEFLKDPSNK
jgi:hypothetical protein